MMNDKQNEDKVYKTSAFREEIRSDIEAHMDQFKDPLVLGELVYKLLEERENTNRILKNLLTKIDALERQLVQQPKQELLLPKVDEDILHFVVEQGKATAEEVRGAFNYKGTNAASARLNRLYGQGLLDKKQVGKKMFFLPKV